LCYTTDEMKSREGREWTFAALARKSASQIDLAGGRIPKPSEKKEWVDWDSNPEPTPKAFGAALLIDMR
jgi:hypothetical protein